MPQSYATWPSQLHPDDLASAEPKILHDHQDGGDISEGFRLRTKEAGGT